MIIQSCNLTGSTHRCNQKQEEIGLYIRYISIYPWNIGIFYEFGLFSSPRIRTRPGGVWRIDAILFGRGLFWGQIFGLSKPFLDQRPTWQVSLTLKVSFGHIFGYCPVILMSKKFIEKFWKKIFLRQTKLWSDCAPWFHRKKNSWSSSNLVTSLRVRDFRLKRWTRLIS